MRDKKLVLSEEALNEIEKHLAEIIAEFGYLKGRSSKATKVLAYIYIRGEVTQQLLRKLTGCSLGTISTVLQQLEKSSIVSKNRITNSRQYSYKINETLSEVLSSSMTALPVYLSQMSVFLKEIEKKLNTPSLPAQPGYSEIKHFLDEMNVIVSAYGHIVQKIQTMTQLMEKEADKQ